MKTTFLVVASICLCLCIPGNSQHKPNIIFIMADDMGYGEIEPFGQTLIKTPSLGQMAREGMIFTNHYAGTCVCAPSRCALITGLHTGHCEIRGNLQNGVANGQHPISDAAVTIAELLKSAGYTTAIIGKWGLGNIKTPGNPTRQGFDFFYGYTDQVLAHNHFPEYLFRNNEKEYLKNKVNYLDPDGWHQGLGSVTEERNQFADELFTTEALKFITENRSKNFFLYLPYIIPHANDEGQEGFKFEVPSQREYAKTSWSKDEKDYAASISYLDEYVGKILKHLKTLKLDKNTLVIFTSDNGARVHQMRFKSAGQYRGFKRDLYEGGIRVPFIAWWPSRIKPRSVTDHVSTFWDFMPTACGLAGVKTPYTTDGISYASTLLGTGDQAEHDHVYFEFHEGEGSQAIRKGNWKAVVRGIKTKQPQPLELYNLDIDPSEKNDVAARHPEKVKEMAELIKEAHRASELFPLPSEKN